MPAHAFRYFNAGGYPLELLSRGSMLSKVSSKGITSRGGISLLSYWRKGTGFSLLFNSILLTGATADPIGAVDLHEKGDDSNHSGLVEKEFHSEKAIY